MDDEQQFSFDYSSTSDNTYSITYSGSDSTATYDSDTIAKPTFSIDIGNLNDTGSEYVYNDPASIYNDPAEGKMHERLETIEKRLNILVPDPKKLEKFEALKKAYEHYKHLEQLCEIQDEEENGPNC